jgi:predicted Zn-dependent peptidase
MKVARAFLGLVLAFSPAICSAQNATVVRAGGVTVVSQPDSNASLTGVEIMVDAGLDRQQLSQNGLAALVAQTLLESPVENERLLDAVSSSGGSVSFRVEAHDVRFYVEALANDAPNVLALFSRALSSPDFSPGTIRAARQALDAKISAQQSEPLDVGIQMLDLAAADGANLGSPPLGTPASLVQFSPSDVAGFYRAYYRRGNEIISAAGRTDALGDRGLRALANALPSGSTRAVETKVIPLRAQGQQLVTRRAISSPWLVVHYGAPPLASGDYGPMLVLSAFLQRTLGDIAEVPGTITPTLASQAVGAEYEFESAPANLTLYVDGGIGNAGQSFGAALSVVKLLGTTKIQGSIEQFKQIAEGNFEQRASTLEAQAWLGGLFAQRTGSADYLTATLHAIDATTPADLQRVAHRYLGNPTIALVLPRSSN